MLDQQPLQELLQPLPPLLQQPLQNQSESTEPSTYMKVDPNGGFEFSSNLPASEIQDIIDNGLAQASYYKDKATRAESERTEKMLNFDGVMVVFAGCILSLMLFFAYVLTSTIISNFTQKTGETTNVR